MKVNKGKVVNFQEHFNHSQVINAYEKNRMLINLVSQSIHSIKTGSNMLTSEMIMPSSKNETLKL